MAFVGRARELTTLEAIIRDEQRTTALIYGRRRVGKSELIKQCLRQGEYRTIYYECKQTTEANNVASLSALLSEAGDLPRLAFSGIEELLDYLFRRSETTPEVLVLDEYPYLRQSVRGMDSILQAVIDKYRGRSLLTLVLCGSYIDAMKSLLENENPLYGRMDGILEIKPMDYYDSALFYPDFSAEDKVRLYSVFGGIPYYNRLIDTRRSVRENIQELIATPGARLENEVAMYLMSQISKINNANEVFEALARGFSKFSDILSQSHVSSGPALVDVLDRLIRMELVGRRTPINDERNRRKARYNITDNLAAFYYRYIFRYLSQRNIMDPNAFFDRYIADDFETQHVPHAFEVLCAQYLIRCNRNGLLPETFDQIGSYYYDDPATRSNGEFDIVTHDPQGYRFYEAKFRKEAVTAAMMEEEIRQVKARGLTCYRYGFFSRSGFAAMMREDVDVIELEALYR